MNLCKPPGRAFSYLCGMNNRVWVYLSDKPLAGPLEQQLKGEIEAFLAEWNAHGTALSAAYELRHEHFIIISADEEKFTASGCSIDKQLRFIKETEQKHTLSLLNRLLVAYKAGNEVKVIHASKVPALLADGTLNENTPVYNVGVSSEAELENNFEVPLKESWLVKYLKPV
jgi:hypothetical protein